VLDVSDAFGSLDELGEGHGFRKVRRALGVEAFGVNAIVYPPRYEGPEHYHDTQDELYFVHKGRIRVDVGGESRELDEGGLFHASSTTPRRISNAGDEDAIVFVVGGKGGYVERDGHLVNPDVDLPRRQGLG
jgi:quercetin dioxygenase-like cupin family protein